MWSLTLHQLDIFFLLKEDFTLCLKKRVNFETVQLEIIRIDFDDIWQKYSKYSRIEFACCSFCVSLLPNVIKIDPYNFELYRFKVYAFFETQCSILRNTD